MKKIFLIIAFSLATVLSLAAKEGQIKGGISSTGKYIKTTDRLKLRESPALGAKVITVLETGTFGEILDFGKTEAIDGMNCNWIKIDTGENEGWCYGGYARDIFFGLTKNLSREEIEEFIPDGSYFSKSLDEMGEININLIREGNNFRYRMGYFDGEASSEGAVDPSSISITYEPYYVWNSNEQECYGAYTISFGASEYYDIKTGAFHKGEPVLVQEQIPVIYEGNNRTVTETATRYSDHSEKSSPFGFNFVINQHKMKNCTKVYKGSSHRVFGRSIIKYPFNGKKGWWYLIYETIREYNGEYLLSTRPGFYWVFEDFLSAPENEAAEDRDTAEKEFEKDGALRIHGSENAKWGVRITDWDHEAPDETEE